MIYIRNYKGEESNWERLNVYSASLSVSKSTAKLTQGEVFNARAGNRVLLL